MAEHGIEGTELRQINRVTRQRNLSAIDHHFDDRGRFIDATRNRRRPAG